MSICLLSYPTILHQSKRRPTRWSPWQTNSGTSSKCRCLTNTPNSFEHAKADQHKGPQPPVARLLAAARMHPFSTGDEHTMVSTRGHSHERSFLCSQERFD
jgi:hypothetical protein